MLDLCMMVPQCTLSVSQQHDPVILAQCFSTNRLVYWICIVYTDCTGWILVDTSQPCSSTNNPRVVWLSTYPYTNWSLADCCSVLSCAARWVSTVHCLLYTRSHWQKGSVCWPTVLNPSLPQLLQEIYTAPTKFSTTPSARIQNIHPGIQSHLTCNRPSTEKSVLGLCRTSEARSKVSHDSLAFSLHLPGYLGCCFICCFSFIPILLCWEQDSKFWGYYSKLWLQISSDRYPCTCKWLDLRDKHCIRHSTSENLTW